MMRLLVDTGTMITHLILLLPNVALRLGARNLSLKVFSFDVYLP